MTEQSKQPHKFGEAFMLMWYACERDPGAGLRVNPELLARLPRGCGHRERIWNSRNGVTPFGLSCPSCGKPTLSHTNWKGDEYAPDHKLANWQRYFRDGTDAEAVAILERRFVSMAQQGYAMPSAEEKAAILAESKQSEFQPGWPMVDINLPEYYKS